MNVVLFFFGLTLSFILTACTVLIMRKYNVVDSPKKHQRKIHKKNIPLGGGVAPYVTMVVLGFFLYATKLIGFQIDARKLIGVALGGLILIVGGLIDDKYELRPRHQILFPVIATLTIIAFGIGPHEVTNPLGGIIQLDLLQFHMGALGNFVVFADLLVFFWLMGVMYTTKLLDVIYGIVSGQGAIGAFIIFLLTMQPALFQPEIQLLSIGFLGTMLGFLIWNWHPAKIFLGEGGSLFVGFFLGVLAILSGSKIATTMLVFAVPMLDLVRVFLVRIKNKKPFYVGDREHLHHKLLEKGFSQKKTAGIFYMLSLLFGILGVYISNKQKLLLLAALVCLLIPTVYFSVIRKSYE